MSATQPSSLSTAGLYQSNWSDLIAIWHASSRAQTDTSNAGPRLGELHLLDGPADARGINHIVDSTGFFRDESRGVAYVDAHPFRVEAWFESDPGTAGILTTRYTEYKGAPLDFGLERRYAAIPNQPFLVIEYRITNPTATPITINVLDQVHLANLRSADPNGRVHAWYDGARNALVADMSASGQFYVVLGAFESVDSYQIGDDTNASPTSPVASPWVRFQANGALPNNGDLQTGDVDLAFQKSVTVASGATVSLAFYLTVRPTLSAALAASDAARARSADAWLGDTAASYTAWSENAGRAAVPSFEDDGINQAFKRSLIVIKNAQNPELGTIPAATNPFAYGHKTWVRDASITAIALDASGHTDDAEIYWRWMAGAQGSDGSWKTTYSAWDASYLPFVEPENDSIGAFIYGVCRHYQLTGDGTFLRDLWPMVQRAADYVLTRLASNGFGPADYSIWEEGARGLEHNTYTQTWYVIGFYAIQQLAEQRGDTELADWYAGGAASIMTAFQRPDDAFPPGMWNARGGYFNRAVRIDNTVQPLVDSSSNVLVALGVVDAGSARAKGHLQKTTSTLACDQWGMCRYLDDSYYYSDPYNPAGDEVLALSPAWPQMSMWVAIHENATGSRDDALARLRWFVGTMGIGYMPQGEAVSNVSRQSVLSSMCEPLTASSFILAALCMQRPGVLPIAPPIYNAGAHKTIAVHFGTLGDWPQWSNVPYFVPAPPRLASAPPQTTIERVYLANDDAFLYVRIDNVAGALSAYKIGQPFALRVYSSDLAHGALESSKSAADGGALARAASFMVERRSDSDDFTRSKVVLGLWTGDGIVEGALPPQWDPALGRAELAIPIAALSSAGTVRAGWAHLSVTMAVITPGGSIVETHRALFHYRLSSPNEAWIYGNIEA